MRPVLSQTQIIRSLGEALSWLERELDWGVSLAALPHLTGRIGELYAAMLTRGQMALAVNQRGYDVVDDAGTRISVKTITSSGRASFNPRTIHMVDRIMIFQVVVDDEAGVSIRTLLDIGQADFRNRLRYLANGDIDFPVRPEREARAQIDDQAIAAEAEYHEWSIHQYENTTIRVARGGEPVFAAMPELRIVAAQIGVGLRNGNEGLKNTRQLGANIIDAIKGLKQ